MTSRRLVLAVVVVPLVSIAALVVYLLAIQGRLPDQVVTHWGPGGEADGFSSPRALAPLFGGLAVVVWMLLAAISLSSPKAIGARSLVGLANGTTWFLAAIAIGTTAPQLDGDGPVDLPGWSLPVAVVAGLAGWGLALMIAGPAESPEQSSAPAPADAERLDLPAGHTAVWSARTPSATIAVVLGGATAAFGLVLAAAASWWILAILLPVAALLVASSSYRITIGPGAIDVSGLLFGFPRLRVPMAEVVRADAGEVDAWSFGGWGIRLGANNETAVLTRSGPALVVTRTDGAVLRISLDDPEPAAATVATLLDRRSSDAGPSTGSATP